MTRADVINRIKQVSPYTAEQLDNRKDLDTAEAILAECEKISPYTAEQIKKEG